MSIYRLIQTDFWQDAFILDLTPEEKYFYLYLLTNSKTKQCGIYELPIRIIETETGYNRETIEKLVDRFERYNKISYDKNTKEIYIKNWIKHNKMTNIKVRKCIEKELHNTKSIELIRLFLKEVSKYGYTIDYNIENLNLINTTQINATNSINDENKKIKDDCIKEFARLYEQNIGLINGIGKEWLIDISKNIDIELFRKAIKIATDKGKCSKGYINGIINQWISNNIKCITELNSYELSIKNKGDNAYGSHKQYEYASRMESEDESIYSKPTNEQLQEARKLLEGI